MVNMIQLLPSDETGNFGVLRSHFMNITMPEHVTLFYFMNDKSSSPESDSKQEMASLSL